MKIDTGSTAWMLAATALVLLMTPGLAFFYGGMTRAKSVLNMMMMSWVAIITVTIAWVLYGDSLSFGKGNGFIGGFEYLGEPVLAEVLEAADESVALSERQRVPVQHPRDRHGDDGDP